MQMIDPSIPHVDVDLIFDTIDQDGSKTISFVEFVAATIDPREVDIQEMNQAFRLLDQDQKGYITCQDLHRALYTSSDCNGDDNEGEMGDRGEGRIPLSDHELELMGPKARQEKRMKKLNARILEIIKRADVNNDGVKK